MRIKKNRVIIVAGGTGGHVLPGYSLINHLKKNKGIETNIITDLRGKFFFREIGYNKIKIINSSTIYTKNVFKLSISILQNLLGFFKSTVYLFKEKPGLIIGMGGYSSFVICVSAKLLGIPVVIYENNLVLGKANKYLLSFIDKIFISSEKLSGISEKYQNKKVVVGNIIRKEILNYKHTNNFSKNQFSILVLGGSQSAKIFGQKFPLIFKKLKDENINLKIYQQCLESQTEEIQKFYQENNIDSELFSFTKNIINYFKRINLVITRGGASSLAELVNSNIPFITIPLPSAADNHQLNNAKYYENKGSCKLIEEKDIDSKLYDLIKILINDNSKLDEIIINQKKICDNKVYSKIDEEIKKILNAKY